MGRRRATSEEWRRYYERAARMRAVVGDPFRRQVEREIMREKLFAIGSGLFAILTATAWVVWASAG